MAGIDVRGVDAAGLPEEAFPGTAHEFRIHVSQDAFDRITTRGGADTSREVGGVLVGRACRDAGGAYVRVEATIDALHAEEKGTELTFTHATWDYVHKELEQKHRGASIVGWYHTHPGFGIFLSDRDEFIHRSFFNLAFQVALVFDPLSREHGVFAWRDNEPVRVRRWWVGGRESIWDGAHPPRGVAAPKAPPKEDGAVEAPNRTETSAGSPDFFSLGLGALFVLVLGGFGGWWLAMRSAQDVVRDAQTATAEEHVRGMRDAVRDLNLQLLGTLRTALDTKVRDAELESAIAELDAAGKAVAALGDPAKDQFAALGRVRAKLVGVRDAAPRFAALTRDLETVIRSGSLDPQEVAKALREQGQVLGQLCAVAGDSAARQNDAQQALLFYKLAARSDPGNADAYAKKAESLAAGTPK